MVGEWFLSPASGIFASLNSDKISFKNTNDSFGSSLVRISSKKVLSPIELKDTDFLYTRVGQNDIFNLSSIKIIEKIVTLITKVDEKFDTSPEVFLDLKNKLMILNIVSSANTNLNLSDNELQIMSTLLGINEEYSLLFYFEYYNEYFENLNSSILKELQTMEINSSLIDIFNNIVNNSSWRTNIFYNPTI